MGAFAEEIRAEISRRRAIVVTSGIGIAALLTRGVFWLSSGVATQRDTCPASIPVVTFGDGGAVTVTCYISAPEIASWRWPALITLWVIVMVASLFVWLWLPRLSPRIPEAAVLDPIQKRS